MITNSVTHYQTCFKAIEKNDAYRPLTTIQNIVYGWLLIHEEDQLCRDSNIEFFKKCNWSKLYATHSYVRTNTVYSDNFRGWAMRYTHRDSDLGWGRSWYVDIGVKEEDAVATFYCRVSYVRSRYDLSIEHPIPTINTPGFIRYIVAEKSGLKVYSGEKEFGLFDKPVPIKIRHGKPLADLIQSPERRYAMIVFNPDSDTLKKEANCLAYDLAGKSQVLVLDDDLELAEELEHYLPKDLSIHPGKYRVFYPMNPASPRPNRHRWFDPLDSDYKIQRQGLVSNLLRFYDLEEPRAITNISDVGRMVRMEVLRNRLSESLAHSQDMKEFQEMWDSREQEFEEREQTLKRESEHWMSELEEKESEVWHLKSKLSARESSTPHKQYEGDEVLLELKDRVKNLHDVVGIFSRIFKDRLLFANEAYKSAANYTQFKVLDRAFDMLYHVGTTLFNLQFEEDQPGNIATRFHAISGFEFARGEGRQSKRDKSIRATRLITVNGKQYEIWPHIKFGNKPPKILRVYFAFDEDLKKIVIGHVGKHLKNATTRSMKY